MGQTILILEIDYPLDNEVFEHRKLIFRDMFYYKVDEDKWIVNMY